MMSCAVQADGASADGTFSRGLLDPAAPVPSVVKGLTPKRYAVYRNNVTVGLVRAMEANFPAVRKLLGETYFSGLAREFVQAHPPQSPLLFFYGSAFPEYLAGQDDLADYPYLADVARLEQQWRISYHAADQTVLGPQALGAVDPDHLMDVVFKPHPAFAVLPSEFALFDIFKANRENESANYNPAAPQDVLITRPGVDVLVHHLPAGGAAFFSRLAYGEALGAAAEEVAAHEPDFDLSQLIALMIRSGAFSFLHIPAE
jgi:hypothetical protein